MARFYKQDGTMYANTANGYKQWVSDVTSDTRQIATTSKDGGYVSTTWVGLELIKFKTTYFDKTGKELDTESYETKTDALEGHEVIVDKK